MIQAFNGLDSVVSSVESLSKALSDGANAWEIFMDVVKIVESTINAVGDAIKATTVITELLGSVTEATAAKETVAGA